MSWQENEEQEILSERKSLKGNFRTRARLEAYINKRLFIMLGMFFFACTSFMYQDNGHYKHATRWFPDTWKCKVCGYENYEGINNCGVCGEPR
jgi:hypothetical protein